MFIVALKSCFAPIPLFVPRGTVVCYHLKLNFMSPTCCVECFHFEGIAPLDAALLAAECWPEAGMKTLKPSQSPQVPEAEQAGSQAKPALFLHTVQGRAISTLREWQHHSVCHRPQP